MYVSLRLDKPISDIDQTGDTSLQRMDDLLGLHRVCCSCFEKLLLDSTIRKPTLAGCWKNILTGANLNELLGTRKQATLIYSALCRARILSLLEARDASAGRMRNRINEERFALPVDWSSAVNIRSVGAR